MLFLILAALQAGSSVSASPPAPLPPTPFTHKVEVMSRLLAASVTDEFKRCGDARTNSNGRYVEAMGTARFSSEWRRATETISDALTICRGLRRALRDRKDFLLDVMTGGSSYDSDLASREIDGVSFDLEATERYFREEAARYRGLLMTGWGDPHCVERPDGYMPPSSICPKASSSSQQ